jgi:cytochrome c oxidase cbb3-type subunit 3
MRRALLAVLALLSIGACRGREERTPGPVARIAVRGGPESGEPERAGGQSDVARGKGIYAESCAPCHGPDGTGGTPMARMMRVGNLADPATHARYGDEEMAALIRGGRGRMPAFSNLGMQQIRDVVAYVRTLKR